MSEPFHLHILPGMPGTLVNRLRVLRQRPMTERERQAARNAWWSKMLDNVALHGQCAYTVVAQQHLRGNETSGLGKYE